MALVCAVLVAPKYWLTIPILDIVSPLPLCDPSCFLFLAYILNVTPAIDLIWEHVVLVPVLVDVQLAAEIWLWSGV